MKSNPGSRLAKMKWAKKSKEERSAHGKMMVRRRKWRKVKVDKKGKK